tara:strand:+ start:17983 stop:20028 length:2046 start_codon:yes stop_codon:yes gene_type:complete
MLNIFEKLLKEELESFANHVKETGSYDIIYEDTSRENVPLATADSSQVSKFSDKIKDLMKYIPKFVPNEAWGNPTSVDRKSVDKLFYWIRKDAMQAGGGMEGIRVAFQKIIDLQNDVEVGGKRFQKMGGILRRLIILESLRHMIESYTDSSAGFVFEGFLAALLGGKQHIEKEGGELLITDVTGFSEDSSKAVAISLKLLSGGKPGEKKVGDEIVPTMSVATGIHGSFRNLIVQLNDVSQGAEIIYLIAYKEYSKDKDGPQSLSLGMFRINRDNFISIMNETGNAKKLIKVKRETLVTLFLDGLYGTDGKFKELSKILLEIPYFASIKNLLEDAQDDGKTIERPALALELENILSSWKEHEDGMKLFNEIYALAANQGGLQPGKAGAAIWDNALKPILMNELPEEDPTTTAGTTPKHAQDDLDDKSKDKTQWTITRDYYEKFSGQDYEARPDKDDPTRTRKRRVDPKVQYDKKPVTKGTAFKYYQSLGAEDQKAFIKKHGVQGTGITRMTKADYEAAVKSNPELAKQLKQTGQTKTGKPTYQYPEKERFIKKDDIAALYDKDNQAAFRVADKAQWNTRHGFMDIGSVTVNPTKITLIAKHYAAQISDQIVEAFKLLAEITENTNQFFAQTDRAKASDRAYAAADGAQGFETEARREFGYKEAPSSELFYSDAFRKATGTKE